jgi:cytosine/adenosine deaminase-related metal-dependent hydrolase
VAKRIDGSRDVLLGQRPPSSVPSSIDAPQTPEHARLAVIRAKTDGYDFIKAYQHLDAATFRALMITAREQGIRVAGHLPEIDCRGCVSREQAFEHPLNAIAHLEELSRYALQTDLSAEDVPRLTSLVSDAGSSVVTTLTANRNIVYMYANRELPPLSPEDARHVDSVTLRDWLGPRNAYLGEPFRRQPGADKFPAAYDFQRSLARNLWKAGVPLIAGTDATMPGLNYGSSLIDEMIELNKIGLRPHEVLQAATRNALVCLAQDRQAGKIVPGARADLVLLEANPLEFIGNVRSVAGVVAAGRWLSSEELRSASEDSEAFYRSLDRRLKISR